MHTVERCSANIQTLNVQESLIELKTATWYINYVCDLCCMSQCHREDPTLTVRRVDGRSFERVEVQLIYSGGYEHEVVYSLDLLSIASCINA